MWSRRSWDVGILTSLLLSILTATGTSRETETAAFISGTSGNSAISPLSLRLGVLQKFQSTQRALPVFPTPGNTQPCLVDSQTCWYKVCSIFDISVLLYMYVGVMLRYKMYMYMYNVYSNYSLLHTHTHTHTHTTLFHLLHSTLTTVHLLILLVLFTSPPSADWFVDRQMDPLLYSLPLRQPLSSCYSQGSSQEVN